MKDWAAKLLPHVPELFWFREYHVLREGAVHVGGFVVSYHPIVEQELRVTVDEMPVDWSLVPAPPHVREIFWFLPEESVRGIRISWADAGSPPTQIVSVNHAQEPCEHQERYQFVIEKQWETLEPTPPIVNIERVSGKGATAYNYYNNGATDSLRFTAAAARAGVDPRLSGTRVLDWGCGCARLTRHFLGMPFGRSRVTGIDIDAENIAWCSKNLAADRFAAVDLKPPTPFCDQSFDLIIGNSVLSHLREDDAAAWLAECRRLLRPRGVALLSYHGEFSICACLSRSQDFAGRVLASGFDATVSARELHGVIVDHEYYRQTYMTDAYARRLFGAYLEFEDRILGAVSRYQNLAVLRRVEHAGLD